MKDEISEGESDWIKSSPVQQSANRCPCWTAQGSAAAASLLTPYTFWMVACLIGSTGCRCLDRTGTGHSFWHIIVSVSFPELRISCSNHPPPYSSSTSNSIFNLSVCPPSWSENPECSADLPHATNRSCCRTNNTSHSHLLCMVDWPYVHPLWDIQRMHTEEERKGTTNNNNRSIVSL